MVRPPQPAPRGRGLADLARWPRRPLLMGIVNITPDSFSDGGRFLRWERAVEHGLALLQDGADLLDLGAESTRPGAPPVDAEEEWARLEPVLRALRGETDAPLSVDSRRPSVVARALELGADWINDVGGLGDPAMAPLLARTGAGTCVMHMQGDPESMQRQPRYDDVVREVVDFLRRRARRAEREGLVAGQIWVDPGIGFGKDLDHNLQLMRHLDRIAALGYPVVLGASRKRFIAALSGDPVERRLAGSLAACEAARHLPHSVLRVHDVRETRQYLLVRAATEAGHPVAWERLPTGTRAKA